MSGLKREDRLPKVSILLGTYNGARFLAEQLDSFANQSHADWDLWISDDGSTDGTLKIIDTYRGQWGDRRITIFLGPQQGFTANFLALARRCDHADFYAYSDQDDIWEPDKLAHALAFLQAVPSTVPALYCSRTWLVDSDNRVIGLSPLFKNHPGFANALVQSIGGGNTMVFNEAARSLLLEAGSDIEVAAHDWWLYLLVSGCGGVVHYDPRPSLRYRQHESNVIGMNASLAGSLWRIRRLWEGRFRDWNTRNIIALRRMRHRLTPECAVALDEFERARSMKLLPRLIGLKKSGIYRQTFLGNLGLVAAAVANKI